MKWMGISIIVLLAGGCATQQAPKSAAAPMAAQRTATALAFDPPILSGQPRLDLSRETREPSAFVGYDSVTTSSFDVYTDNRQSNEPGESGYDRDSVTEKVGVSTR
jgi:hypothetical protein